MLRAEKRSGVRGSVWFPLVFTFGERIVVVTKRDFAGVVFGVVLLLYFFVGRIFIDFITMAPRRLVRAGIGAANIAVEVAIGGEWDV